VVSGKHRLRFISGKDPLYPLDRRLGGPRSLSWHRLEEKSFASVGDQTSIVQSVVGQHTD
jgi:hypothetical protein